MRSGKQRRSQQPEFVIPGGFRNVTEVADVPDLFPALRRVIHRRGPWRSMEAVEFATLEWADWFNNWRPLEPIGNMPPAEAEARYPAQAGTRAMAA